ncbi:S8 family serine peptidase [Halomarina oriensis]|uniref:S8 family serine peptidase n=1 Tax=Halomarina oriensis TaxID=671145 RepID=A0A6B0GFY8_9EURY|nr:S8 family serine peptidase [Halomarina oriensis]MWG32947.1 S8 family serine peptidase [Halomarina oriensis]
MTDDDTRHTDGRTIDRRTVLKGAGALGAATVLPFAGTAGATSTDLPTVDDALDTATDTLQEVLVVFDSNADVDHLRHLDLAEGYFTFSVLPVGYTLLTGTQVEEVASWSDVRYVEANHEVEFHNDDAREVTGVKTVQEKRHYTGETVHAVVIDSGVDGDHPDLKGNLQHNFRFVDPLDEETMWVDAGPVDTASLGHGTHVSGTVAGDGTESDGTYRGMAPDADLTVYSTDAAAALLNIVGAYDDLLDRQRAGKHDVQVVNNSYGAGGGDDYNPNGALETATWYAVEEGILPIFSAGNSGPGTQTLGNYAKGPHVLASAATDDDMNVTDFSSRGRKPSYSGGGEGAHYDRREAFRNLSDFFDTDRGDQPVVAEQSFSGTVGPGSSDAGVGESAYEQFTAPKDAGTFDLTVSWTPPGEDLDIYVHEGTKDGPVVASGATLQNPEELSGGLTGGETYFVEVRPFVNLVATYSAELTMYEALPKGQQPSGPYGIYRPSAGTPGELVMSTLAPDDGHQAYTTAFAGAPEEQGTEIYYGRLSGTSMSGPVLTGICALVYDAIRQEEGEFPDPIDVIKIVEATAHDAREGHNTWNVGSGFADADDAIEMALSNGKPKFKDAELAVDGEVTDPLFSVSGSRSDDGSVFTGGQTNQVTIGVSEATKEATVRDRIPFDWTLVGGDSATVYTDDGARYVEFDASATSGDSLTYFLEAPSGAEATGSYEFGPAAARPVDGAGAFVPFTESETDEVVGEDTDV